MTRVGLDPREAGGAVGPGPADRDAIASWPMAPVSRPFTAATVAATLVVGLAGALVVLDPGVRPDDAFPILIAGAALCLALLARHAAPGLAWLALVVASLVAAGVPIGLSRTADPVAGVGPWLVAAVRASAAAIVTVVIASLYAARPERRLTRRVTTLAIFLAAWLAVACLLGVVLVLVGARSDPAFNLVDIAITPIALFLHFVLLLAGLGVAGDIRAAAVRADVRLGRDRPGDALVLTNVDRARATLRELIPGQANADAAAIDAERTRLAGDLHATVLPLLRRVIADAEAGAPLDELAGRLRSVDLELERLMADRWPVVLDAFGLVDALEDLAERTESETPVQVLLEIEGSSGRPRPEIERTAWRIAQIALDNAVRHASASQITLRILVAPDHVRLSIADDGRGLDPGDPVRVGARGLADLSRRASAIGGTIAIEPGRPSGTTVRFDWPATG